MVINIKIEKRIATYIPSDEIPVCGSNLDTVKFTFDKEWDAYPDKFARFIYGTDHHDEPIDGNTCKVPMFINVTTVLIGVFVGEPGADEDCLATTNAEVEFKISARCTNTVPSAGTIKNYTSEAQEYAAEARVAASDAEEWAVVSKNAANRSTESAAYVEGVVNDARDEISEELSPMVSQNTEDIAINRKRITNLEQGITPDPFVTDTTGIVPANALPYAEVVKVGSMTYRDEATNTLKDAKVTSIESRGANLVINEYKDTSGTKNGVTFTVHEDGSVTANGTAEALTDFGLRYTSSHYLTLEPGKTYTLSGCPKGGGTTSYRMAIEETGTYKGVASDKGDGSTFTANIVNHFLFIRIASGATVNNITFKPMLVEGDVVVPFKPYRADAVDTLEIPEAVQALDGYGLGVDATYNNCIDWDKKQYIQNVKKLVLNGSESWYYASNYNCMTYTLPTGGVYGTPVITSNDIYCGYTSSSATGIQFGGKHSPIEDVGVSSVAEWKAYLAELYANGTPITVVYALAEPIVTDISDLLPDDNFIEVEGGGTIVAVNAENLEAPTEITYMTKEATV